MFYCLKVGDKYSHDHVYKLAEQVNITCITNDKMDIPTVKLPNYSFYGVWWKMLLFNEDFVGPGQFLDLDVKILRPIDSMFQAQHYMTLLKTDWEDLDQLHANTIGDRYKYCSINSSVMAWNDNRHDIWLDFYKNHKKIMHLFNGIDTYLEHRHLNRLSFFPKGLVGSYRCNPQANVAVMSYDGEGKQWF